MIVYLSWGISYAGIVFVLYIHVLFKYNLINSVSVKRTLHNAIEKRRSTWNT